VRSCVHNDRMGMGLQVSLAIFLPWGYRKRNLVLVECQLPVEQGAHMDGYGVSLMPGSTNGNSRSAVFAYALWIQDIPQRRPIAPVPDIQWQEAVGRRLLTPAETAARCRYFDRKARVGLALCG
jgi:hypothetical protein